MIDEKKIDNEEEIKPYDIYEDIREPYDYDSEEYMSVVEKIKRQRDNYRKQQEMSKLMKLKYFGKNYD